MSWDVDLLRLDENALRFDPYAPTYAIGDVATLSAILHATIPSITHQQSRDQFTWEQDGCSFVCSFWWGRTRATHGRVDAIAIWITGPGEPMPCIVSLCKALSVRACDVVDMALIDLSLSEPSGLLRFRMRGKPSLRAIAGGREFTSQTL